MRISVRFKLTLLVASALLTLALVGVVSEVVEARNRARLADIEARLLPRLAVGPRIETEFMELGRQLQGAIARRDPTALAETLDTKGRIFRLIAEAGPAIDLPTAALLRWSVQDYYEAAVAVSTLHIQGEPGERQLQRVSEMQRRRHKAEEVMREATAVDEAELAGAFLAARKSGVNAGDYRRVIAVSGVIALLLLGYWASRQMLASLSALSSGLSRFSTGDFTEPVRVETNDELGDVAREANAMARNLRDLAAARDDDDWIKSAHVEIADKLRGNLTPSLVAEHTMRFLVQRTEATAGALYLLDGADALVLAGSYARHADAHGSYSEGLPAGKRPIQPRFQVGEGLLGQAFLSSHVTVVRDLPAAYFRLVSGLGESPPRMLALVPLSTSDKAIGVIELALLTELGPAARELLESVRSTLAVNFEAAEARLAREKLLAETQRQAERLSAQEEKLRQNNQELASQQQALERVSHYKSQFLANMSHELRTPLNSMLVLSHLLAENSAGNLVDKQVEYASTIHAAGEDLLTLINQVLDLSKIEAGKEQVKVGPVPLADLAQGLGRIFRPLAEEKGLVFIVEVGSDVPATIESDRTRIERILMNLLGNAIKFTERGTINFTIDLFRPHPGSLRPAHRRGEAIAFSVSDTGIGIAESEQERIFAPFEQIEASSARRYQGTGLGLTIARESALLLGGELTLDSTPGEGSTFTFTLRPKPSRASKPSDAPAARGSSDLPPGSESHLQGQRVLVVEDDMRTAYSLLALLESKGCRVRVAENGHDALGELDQDPSVDCIVMDITMPDLNGYETMRQLRSRPGLGAVPIIALTANAAQEERERWLAAGASDHLAKPVDPASLLSVLQACAARQVRA